MVSGSGLRVWCRGSGASCFLKSRRRCLGFRALFSMNGDYVLGVLSGS